MAASLQNRIEDYIGPRHSDMELTDWVTALSQWLTASAKELFDIIPEMTLKKVAPATMSSATTGTSLAGKRIFGVDIAGYPAREVPALEYAKVTNQNSIHYARSTDPVFYIKEGKLYVTTDGAETAEGTIHYISAPEVTYDLTTVPYFPTEYEPLVVLGAAVRGKMRQIVDTRSTLPAALNLSSITIPEKPSAPVFSYTDATASPIEAQTATITGDAPTYTAPVLSFSDFPTVTALEIPASGLSIPTPVFSVPDITTVTVSAPDDPPAYDSELVDQELSELAALIDDEEDEELARAKVSQIQAIISHALNQFNEEQVLYSALLQSAVIDAQAAAAEAQTEGSSVLQKEYQEYTSQLQKYTADLQKYQADTTNAIQVFQQNLGKELQVWQTSRQSELQAYTADIQNNLNVFQKESAEYQAKLQVDLLDAQQAQQAVSADAQLSTDVDKTNKLQVLQKEIQEYASVLQKYSADLQQYTAEIGTEIQQFTNNMQIIMTEHGLMGQELQGLQGLYTQELQLLIGGQQSGG